MEIAKNCFVIIEYDLRLEDGTFIKGEAGPVSMNFVAGYSQVLPGLEARLMGLSEGTRTELVIPPAEAFGEHDKNQVRTVSFEEFPAGRNLEPGRWGAARHRETNSEYGYFVVAKTGSSVTLDHNHPLAGKALHYRVTVVRVRPASTDELEFLRPCEHEQTPSAQ
ncbi:MAG: peptidylprolyl isomerase [Syntrophobacter sp.]